MRQQSNSKIVHYIKTPKVLWYWAVLAVDCLAILLLSIPTELVSLVYLRAAVGLLLVFLLPGYSITRVLFPAHSKGTIAAGIDGIERVALSVGLSIALVSIVSLFLRYTPWGSDYQTAISLLMLSAVLSTVALVRESKSVI
jgi:uncharacterized membrane protein